MHYVAVKYFYFYFFLKLYSTHIYQDSLLLGAQKYIKQYNEWHFSQNCYVKDYEAVKLLNLPSWWAAQLPLILDVNTKITDFGVGGNIKLSQKLILYPWQQNLPL